MKEGEQTSDKLSRLYSLVQSLGIHHRSLQQFDHEFIVPLGVITVQDDTGIVDHLNILTIIQIETCPELRLLYLLLTSKEGVQCTARPGLSVSVASSGGRGEGKVEGTTHVDLFRYPFLA